MWNNAGLSTSILITTRSPANGMVHHTVAKIFVSTKLRDLGPKSSPARTFWRMVAMCIHYQPHTKHLLWGLTTFSLASVKTPCVGTGFLGLAYPFFPPKSFDDTPEVPQIPPICPGDHIYVIAAKDVLRRATVTPLPPVGLLEAVLLSLKEGDSLSESTVRRLRRKEAEMRAAVAEGRTPLSEYRRRKQKKMAAKASIPQASRVLDLTGWVVLNMISGDAPTTVREGKVNALQGFDVSSAARVDIAPKSSHQSAAAAINLLNSGWCKVSVEDVERLATRRPAIPECINPSVISIDLV